MQLIQTSLHLDKMKKVLKKLALTLAVFAALTFSATGVYAQQSVIPKPDGIPGIEQNQQADGGLNTRNLLTEQVLPRFAVGTIGFVGTLSILFLIIGGVRFATAYGREEQIESAKKQITWSIAGFLIALLSYTIVSIVVQLDFDNPGGSNETEETQ